MNVKAIWLFPLPLAIAALSLTTTADAGHPLAGELDSVSAATTGPSDLCAELDEYGDPLRCDAVGPGMAPLWDDTVCCDARSCSVPSSTGCATGTTSYWCENAVLESTGALNCVYEVPSYCEVHPCGPGDITAPPVEHAICCYDNVGCYDHEGGLCGGIEVWCGKGATNEDGTVDCLDGEDE